MRAPMLVVNADDMGLCPEVDRGILEGIGAGRVTSVSLLVNPPFRPAVDRLKETPVSIGLHLNLSLGFPVGLSGLASLKICGGRFAPRWFEEHLAVDEREMRDEALRQLDLFETLVGRLPTHLDTHKHIHTRNRTAFTVAADLAKSLAIPLRAQNREARAELRARGVKVTDHFVGGVEPSPFWTVPRLAATLLALPAGVTELMCHPGEEMAEMEGLRYTGQRDVERESLLSHQIGRLLRGISLVSFAEAPLGEKPDEV